MMNFMAWLAHYRVQWWTRWWTFEFHKESRLPCTMELVRTAAFKVYCISISAERVTDWHHFSYGYHHPKHHYRYCYLLHRWTEGNTAIPW